jgi:hypothetical protein
LDFCYAFPQTTALAKKTSKKEEVKEVFPKAQSNEPEAEATDGFDESVVIN